MLKVIKLYYQVLPFSQNACTIKNMSVQQTTESSQLFEDHSVQIITRLKQAILAVISAIPEIHSHRPVDLAAGLNIDTKLAWKIAKLIEGSDPFAAADYIPGTAGFQIFLRAAMRRNIPKALLASVRSAFNSFNELVSTHAGNRRAFDMMLAGHSRDNRTKADIEHRRQMFEGASYTWGVQARVVLRLDILAPAADPLRFDQIAIRGFVDLRRLRPRVPWRISRSFSSDDDGVANLAFTREPLENLLTNGDPGAAPLLPDFCSQPLPACRRVDGPRGVVEFELAEGAVGNTGVLTCVTGEFLRQVEPRYRTQAYHDMSQRLRVRTPCEVVCFDVLMHRDLFGSKPQPTLRVFSDLFAEQMGALYRECDVLPVREKLEHLGTGLDRLANYDYARSQDLAALAMNRAGWDPREFIAFRARMEFPPIPTSMVIAHALPKQPQTD